MTTLEALKAARALIEDPKMWTQGAFARSAKNRPCSPAGEKAVCWCAYGAARKVVSPGYYWPLDNLLDFAGKALGHGFIDDVNDSKVTLADGSTGHPAVLKIYDKAIELAAAESEASRE